MAAGAARDSARDSARVPVAVVSGATGDLGPAVIRALWARGVAVFGFYGRSKSKAKMLERESKQGGHSLRLASVDLKAADKAAV